MGQRGRPAVVDYAEQFYSLLERQSTYDNAKQVHVFKGSLLEVFENVEKKEGGKLSRGYYNRIMGTLKHLECVVVEQTGSFGRPSIVYLIESPYSKYGVVSKTQRVTPNTETSVRYKALEQRVESLEKQIGGMVQTIAQLETAVQYFNTKIKEK